LLVFVKFFDLAARAREEAILLLTSYQLAQFFAVSFLFVLTRLMTGPLTLGWNCEIAVERPFAAQVARLMRTVVRIFITNYWGHRWPLIVARPAAATRHVRFFFIRRGRVLRRKMGDFSQLVFGC
jgi:hypothetical protein